MGNGSGEEPVGRPGPPSGQPPADPASLLQQRQAARERRDFATADAIRDQLRQAGWLVRDTPDGPELTEAPPYQTLDPAALAPRWDEPDRYDVSVVAHVTGWPEDVARATRSLAAHHRHLGYEVLLVSDGAGQATGRALEDLAAEDPHLQVLHLDPAIGFGASMNLAMGQALGRVLVWLDPHVEATGDLLGPLLAALDQPGTGLAGGWGVTTTTMLEFEADDGPEVDAIEGYLLAVPRALAAQAQGRPQGPLLPQRRPRLLLRRPRPRVPRAPPGRPGRGARDQAPAPRVPRDRPHRTGPRVQKELRSVPRTLEGSHRPAHPGVPGLSPAPVTGGRGSGSKGTLEGDRGGGRPGARRGRPGR